MNFTPAGTNGAKHAGADDWFTPGRFAALLGALIIACFPQVIFGLGTFYFRDYQLFGYPLAFYHREAFWRGEIPLWNPYSDCGLPFLAQWNTLTLYPLSLFYVLFPLPWSLSVFCLGHLFLAGMGMYFLAYRWTGNRLAAAVGGIAFAYNGLTWHALMWPNDIAALGWMPWVVLAVERGWKEGGRMVAVGGLAGAMQMLAGAPEVIMMTWVFTGALWVMEWIAGKNSRMRMVTRGAVMGMLVAGLAAAQLLPFFELLAHSHRDNSFGDARWSMPATGIFNYLVPLFHCVAAQRGVYMQRGQYWTSSYYAGVGVVILALMAVWRSRTVKVWFLAGLVALSILMAMGDDGLIYAMLKRIAPQLGFMRFPIKFVVLAVFTLPLLAAQGMVWMRELTAQRRAEEAKRLGWLALGLVVATAGIVIAANIHPAADDDPGMTSLNGLRGALFIAAIAGCLGLLWRRPGFRAQIILQTVLVLALWMDVFTHVPALSPTVPPEAFKPDFLREYYSKNDPTWDAEIRPGVARAMQTLASLNRMYWGGVSDPVNDIYGRRITLYDDINLLDHVPKLDGFYSLYLREMNGVISELYISSNDVPHLRDFFGIARVNPQTNTMEWVERDGWAPVITGGQQALFGSDAQAFRMLFDSRFDGRRMVCLPPEASEVVRATNQTTVNILSTNFTAQQINLEVEAKDGAGMVVVAQAYYPAWRAYVDGKPVMLWRANYAFQALEVPAGRHAVEIVYQDKRFETGCAVSLTSLFTCAGIWILGRRGKRKPGGAG